MLMDIRNILKERGQMSLTDLVRHFYVAESIMLGMLSHWEKKGRIEMVDARGACGTACGCSESESSKIYYRWKSIAQKPIFALTNQ